MKLLNYAHEANFKLYALRRIRKYRETPLIRPLYISPSEYKHPKYLTQLTSRI